jgi:hypothetical protein
VQKEDIRKLMNIKINSLSLYIYIYICMGRICMWGKVILLWILVLLYPSVVPATREAELGRSPEFKSSRPAWAT